MTAQVIDGKAFAARLRGRVAELAASFTNRTGRAAGLAVVLAFVGVKMCAAHWLVIPVQYSLLVIAAVLSGSIIASLAWPEEHGGEN